MKRVILGMTFTLGFFAFGVSAQEAPTLFWQSGGESVPIGSNLAEIELPEGFVYLGSDSTQEFLELNENPTSGMELLTIASRSGEESWFVIFRFEEIGYVEDSGGADLDADALLASLRRGTKEANKERQRRGWAPLEIIGWNEEPHYDLSTNNLTWATVNRQEDRDIINRQIRLLGRRGVMSAILVCNPEECGSASQAIDGLLEGFHYLPGNRYAEFLPGQDTMAKIGLAALIAGGAAAAVKVGLFQKFWKLIVGGGVAVFAALASRFRRKKVKSVST